VTWFTEKIHEHIGQTLEIEEIIYTGNTGYQDLVVFRNSILGRVMVLDGAIQTTEGDEFFYHEMLAHVPLFAHGEARRVLIIGGGDGGLLEECLKHPVERVTEVELDPGVVEAARLYLPTICGQAYDDPRTDLVIGDGAAFVAETEQRYDVILIDSTDPVGPGEVLFTREFYANCKRCLTPGGILATQNGVPFVQGSALTRSVGHFRALFRDGSCFVTAVPTYTWGFMALGWATDDVDARQLPLEELQRRHAAAGFATRYYTPEIHRASFALPGYVRDLVR